MPTRTETRCYHGLKLSYVKGDSNKVCYLLLPEGLEQDGEKFIAMAKKSYPCSIVMLTGMDWNRDMTPWPAQSVFKKEKPFGGQAKVFLKTLENDYFPNVEQMLGLTNPRRYLVGVSLSGLFALWTATVSSCIEGIASISGSFWYDMLPVWMDSHPIKESVRKIYISLSDREKRSKEERMAVVEDFTEGIVETIRRQGIDVDWQLEPGITHFSPIIPRLSASMKSLFGNENENE